MAIKYDQLIGGVKEHIDSTSNPHSVTAHQIGADAILAEIDEYGSTTVGWDKVDKTGSSLADLATRNYSDLSNPPGDDSFHTLTEVSSSANSDEVLLYVAGTTNDYRKITKQNLLSGISVSADKIYQGNTKAEVHDAGSDGYFWVETEGAERFRINSDGYVGIGQSAPTAKLHISAGTPSANTAPIKLTSGTAMSTPEDGAVEYHSSHLYFTIGSTRYQIDQQSGGGGSGDVVGPSSATNEGVARFDTTTGKLIQNSLVIIGDDGYVSIPSGQKYKINGVNLSAADVGAEPTQAKGTISSGTASAISIGNGSSSTVGPNVSITINKASVSQDGYLGKDNFLIFSSKEPALTKGNLTEASSSILIFGGATTNNVIGAGTSIQVKKASVSQDGYLGKDNWSTFNSKENALTFQHSLTRSVNTINLVGDTASPGNSYYYGTNGSGTKGWYVITSGSGDVVGPSSATNEGVVRFDTTTGKLIQNSLVIIGDDGYVSIPSGQKYKINGVNLSATDVGAEPTLTKGTISSNTTSAISITNGSSSTVGPNVSITINKASVSSDGYLGKDNWSTFNSKENALTFQHSLTRSVNTINLVGDSASPGNSQYYGTNGIGTKGWYSLTSGSGDVVGPSSATNEGVARFDTTTGKLIQNSLVIIGDDGYVSIPSGQKYKINGVNLSATDVGAEPTLTKGTISSGTVSAISIANGASSTVGPNVSISINKASASLDGYLGKDDWSLFSGKASLNTPIFTSKITIGVASGSTGSIELKGTTSGTCTITVPSIAGSPTYVLPAAYGSAGQVLSDAAGNGILSWATSGSGSGDVVGPSSATNEGVARFNTTTGKLIQNSLVIIGDDGYVSIPSGQKYKINGVNLSATDVGAEPTQTKGTISSGTTSAISITNGSSSTVGPNVSISINKASASLDGYLGKDNWSMFNSKESALTFQHSLNRSVNTINLVNDSASPGNNQYYGTNGSGTKGWYSLSSGSGDVVGPGSSTNEGIVRFDGITGKLIQNSLVIIGDDGYVSIPSGQKYKINGVNLSATDVGAEPTLSKTNLSETSSSILTITNGTGTVLAVGGTTIQVKKATSIQDGYLSKVDWSTFNSKEPAQTKGTISSSTASAISITNGSSSTVGPNVSISINKASASQDGYLGKDNWSTFNNKMTNPMSNNGDIIIRSGGVASALGIGTSGQVLTVDSGLPSWKDATVGTGDGMVLVYETTLASAAQTITIPSDYLGGTDYDMELLAINNTSTSSEVYVYVNSDTTDTNYYVEQMYVFGSSASPGRYNYPRISYTYDSRKTIACIKLGCFNNSFWWNTQYQGEDNGAAYPFGGFVSGLKTTGSVTSITNLQFKHAQANGFAVGTKVRLYRRINAYKASSTQDGYLSKTDWSTFNNKASLTNPVFTNKITIGVASSATGSIELKGTTSGTCTITVPSVAGTPTYVLPASYGSAGQVLSDAAGNGILSWASGGSGASEKIYEGDSKLEIHDTGSDGYMFFNSNGVRKIRFDSNGTHIDGYFSSNGFVEPISSKSSGHTTTANDYSLLVTTGASDVTIILSSTAAKTGQLYVIKKVDSGAGYVILSPSSGTIDGQTTHSVKFINDSRFIQFDGTNWKILSNYSDSFVWKGTTTNDTLTEIFVDGVSNSRYGLTSGSTAAFELTAIARDNTNNKTKVWLIKAVTTTSSGGTSSIVGSQSYTVVAQSDVSGGTDGWVIGVDANDTDDTFRVTVSGQTSTTIQWVVSN